MALKAPAVLAVSTSGIVEVLYSVGCPLHGTDLLVFYYIENLCRRCAGLLLCMAPPCLSLCAVLTDYIAFTALSVRRFARARVRARYVGAQLHNTLQKSTVKNVLAWLRRKCIHLFWMYIEHFFHLIVSIYYSECTECPKNNCIFLKSNCSYKNDPILKISSLLSQK